MKSSITLVIFLLYTTIYAQEMVSVDPLGARSQSELQSEFQTITMLYGTSYYKVRYTSTDAKGQKDTLSGLLAVPDQEDTRYPVLVYQHGTSACKTCVPSRFGVSGGEEGELGLLFAGLGYVACLPDYVGMGDGRGFQTYVHAQTLASAADDMVKAVRSWTETQSDFSVSDQLFITGYSQGGYASMAYHKYLEQNEGPSAVTAAAHLSGPYNLSGVMRDLILSDNDYTYVAYLPNTVLGFNEFYEIFDRPSEFFKSEYVADIEKYYNGEMDIVELNINLLIKLLINSGRRLTKNMIRDEVLQEIVTNPAHPLNAILRENDLHNWKPEKPTAIFYCMADDQVPFRNSIVARDTMTALGVSDLLVRDVLSSANHGQCVEPALEATISFFRPYQEIVTSTEDWAESELKIYPNPVSDLLTLQCEKDVISQVQWMDISGRPLSSVLHPNSQEVQLNVSTFSSGIYIVRVVTESQKLITRKIIIE